MGALRLHLGLRKTGTTYLQRWLDRSRIAPGTVWVNEFKARETLETNSPLPPYLRGEADVVLSDENLLGMFHNGTKFARPTPRLRALRGENPSIFLCLRSYADYFASSWTESIKRRHYWIFDPGTAPTRRFTDVLQELAHIFPNSPITVWDYAHFRGNEAAVAQLITGNAVVEFGPTPPDMLNQRLSKSAVAYLADQSPPQAGTAFRAFREAHEITESNPRFEAFTAETRKPFDEAFAAEWDEIAKYATIWRPSPQTPFQ